MAAEPVAVAQALSGINWISIFGGAALGSAISGLINIALHQRTINKAAAQRAEDRQDKRKALAFSFHVKLQRILADGHTISRDLKVMAAKAKAHPALAVQALSPSPEKISFSADELALVLSLDDKLFNDVAALDRLHATIAELLTLYAVKRETLVSRFGAKMKGEVGTTELTEAEHDWFMPRLVEADGLVRGLIQFADECRDTATDTLDRWHAVMVREFDFKKTLEFRAKEPAT